MRIAYVTETYPPEINGVALTVARTVDYLRARGHEVMLIRPAQAGERRGASEGELLTAGCAIPFYSDMRFGMACVSGLAAKLRAAGIRLVHVATEGPLGFAALAAARRLGLATTSDFRTNFHQYSRYYGIGVLEPVIAGYLRRFHNSAGRTFAPTSKTRADLLDAGFERVEVVGRGVDLQRFSPARRDEGLRRRWGASDGPVLLYVGRLAAEKKVELAMQAFAAVRRTVPGARMVVVGDGPRRRALQAKFTEPCYEGSQTGEALAASYASADMFVFPSESETFGNVTLEALASGLPVLAFESGAAAELVRDGVNGRVVPPGADAAFVAAARQMAGLPDWRRQAAAAARESVAAHGWDKVLGRFASQLMDEAGDAPPARDANAYVA